MLHFFCLFFLSGSLVWLYCNIFCLFFISTACAVFIMHWRSYTSGYRKISKGSDFNYLPFSDCCLWFSDQLWQCVRENVCIIHGTREPVARDMQLDWNWRLGYVREYHIRVIRFKLIDDFLNTFCSLSFFRLKYNIFAVFQLY